MSRRRVDRRRASHSFSFGYRAASSRKSPYGNSNTTESRIANTDIDCVPPANTPTTAAAAANRYRVPVAVIPSGKIWFQAVMKRFISSSVPIETRR